MESTTAYLAWLGCGLLRPVRAARPVVLSLFFFPLFNSLPRKDGRLERCRNPLQHPSKPPITLRRRTLSN
jgi:hypothetical protein